MGGTELAALGLAGTFAGGAVYVSIAEHPARARLPVGEAVAEFRLAYPRAAVWQGTLAVATMVVGLASWSGTDEPGWLVGSACIGAVPALTAVVLLRPSALLMEGTAPEAAPRVALAAWGRFHALRSALAAGALVAFLVAAG